MRRRRHAGSGPRRRDVAPGIAVLSHERPEVHLFHLGAAALVRDTVGDLEILRTAIPRREGVDLAGQPLKDEPGLHDLAAEVDALLAEAAG